MYKLIFILTLYILGESHGDTSLGSCPQVDPMPGFQIDKFLGYWYAIQKTSSSTPCLSYNITQDEDNENKYKITEIEQHSPLLSTLHHEHHTTGTLTIPKSAEAGRMALDLPLDIGTHTFVVFMTDYENYAGIFTCKKLPLIHKWSAEILSRSPTPDMAFVDKVRTRLSSYNIDPFTLNIVNQKNCAKPGTKGELIQAASNVVANAEEKVHSMITENSGKS